MSEEILWNNDSSTKPAYDWWKIVLEGETIASFKKDVDNNEPLQPGQIYRDFISARILYFVENSNEFNSDSLR
ncbi:hypothetical protein GYA49_02185 [Candidatus Beckwithbacteria bacterium]|nr:hypothetical protein [Candidatus Beckwithbacteria bacterium]